MSTLNGKTELAQSETKLSEYVQPATFITGIQGTSNIHLIFSELFQKTLD